MRSIKKGITVLLICMIVLTMIPVQIFASGKVMPDRDVTLTVSYKNCEKAISNAEFDLYKVADIDEYALMSLTEDFEVYKNTVQGLSDFEDMNQDEWSDMAVTLKGYVQRDGLTPVASGRTDESGILSINIKPGLYLVVGHQVTTDGYYTYTAAPFIVLLPGEDVADNDWNYDVKVSPKFEKDYYPPEKPVQIITRKVLKIWDDSGYSTIRPEETTVQLLKDGKIYDTQKLNEENNWRYVWDNLDAGYEWTVVEKELPDYAVSIFQNGITFTITNKYVVPISVGDFSVQKKIIGDTPKTASTFTFVLSAKDASYPMPAGSTGTTREVSISGAGSTEFGDITFTEPGVYVYTVSEKNTGAEGYTYDSNVYTVTFNVTKEDGELKTQRIIKDSKENTVTALEFTNSYESSGEKLPQTGVMWWPIPVLLLCGCVCLTLGVVSRRRRN